MKKGLLCTLIIAAGLLACTGKGGRVDADERSPRREFQADLKGRNQVPVTPSAAHGDLYLTISDDGSSTHSVLSKVGEKMVCVERACQVLPRPVGAVNSPVTPSGVGPLAVPVGDFNNDGFDDLF